MERSILSISAPAILAALLRADAYPHPAEDVELLETHISWILLAGTYAYKIKKPVDLGFCDFTSLEKRRRACEDELRLNKRLAPHLYIDVAEIRGTPEAPRIGGAGCVLEYAVRMRRFPQEALASRLLADGRLTRELMDAFALKLARFHAALPSAPAGCPFGTTDAVLRDACANFDEIASLLPDECKDNALVTLRDWCQCEFMRQYAHIHERRVAGMTRECHGDLHLGNIVLTDGELVPFDCVEFNPRLRWIDVMSEVAFLFMDLMDHGSDALAWRFLNAYLEVNGTYPGLSVLRFYVVFRAIVRAKVHLIRAIQASADAPERARLMKQYESYIALAQRCTTLGRPAILLMHGFSGCGKSTVALALAEALGGVRIRSDVERKRLHGVAPLARGGSLIGGVLYRSDATRATYSALAEAARVVVTSGYTAIVDATFLMRADRAALRSVAMSESAPIALVDVWAPEPLLGKRIANRARRETDASDATLNVLEHQFAMVEPVAAAENLPVIRVDGQKPIDGPSLRAISHRLFGTRGQCEGLVIGVT